MAGGCSTSCEVAASLPERFFFGHMDSSLEAVGKQFLIGNSVNCLVYE